MDNPQPNKQNPKVSPIDRLRTKIWFEFCARGRTPYWFWKNIDNYPYILSQLEKGEKIKADELVGHKSKWEKYKHGSRTPNTDLVRRVADHFPTSDTLYFSKVWDVLEGVKISTKDIISEIKNLDDLVSYQTLKDCYWDDSNANVLCNNTNGIIHRLKELASFETLQAIILCLGWASNIGNHVFWNKLCKLYQELLPELILDENIPHRFELFETIDAIAKVREFSSETSRSDIPICWTDEVDRCRDFLIQHYANCLRNHDAFFGFPELLFNDEDRQNIAVQMVSSFWAKMDLRYNSIDYWRPLGALFAKLYFSGFLNKSNFAIGDLEEFCQTVVSEYRIELTRDDRLVNRIHLVKNSDRCLPTMAMQQTGLGLFT